MISSLSHSMPSTPSATSNQASQLTRRSSAFHVSSPTSTPYFSNALTSVPNDRRRVGEEVIRSRESSVSSVSERVDKLEEPIKVKKGFEGVFVGESHMPLW